MITQAFSLFAAAGDNCKLDGGSFFAFPHWYKYLDGARDAQGLCTPSISGINDTWLIVAAVIEILLRVAAIAAVIFVIYGGFQYMTSQGEPDATGRAKTTIVNALIGVAVASMAAAIVAFIAGSIS